MQWFSPMSVESSWNGLKLSGEGGFLSPSPLLAPLDPPYFARCLPQMPHSGSRLLELPGWWKLIKLPPNGFKTFELQAWLVPSLEWRQSGHEYGAWADLMRHHWEVAALWELWPQNGHGQDANSANLLLKETCVGLEVVLAATLQNSIKKNQILFLFSQRVDQCHKGADLYRDSHKLSILLKVR